MWCKHCGQDVPAISSSTTSAVRCTRCGSTADDARPTGVVAEPASGIAAPGLDASGDPPGVETLPNFDDWDIDQSFRRLQARLGLEKRPVPPTMDQRRRGSAMRRLDGAHRSLGGRHRPPTRRESNSSVLAWSMLTVGVMTFTCGVALMGWSIVEGRPELWNVGMPLAAGGQMGLVLGLVLQLERVWRNSRHTLEKLAGVDEQLDSLERTTNLLGMTHGTASQAFYAHMAEHANPHLLLADLKGQLDLLATQISNRES
jgi:hypothetical protein